MGQKQWHFSVREIRFVSSFLIVAELRKQACQLENEIDLKLVSFSKLGTNYRSVRDYSPFQSVAHRSHYK